jgi:hypothetical protein
LIPDFPPFKYDDAGICRRFSLQEETMKTHFIQFGRLEEFVQEDLGEGNLVRVVVLDVTESVSGQIPGLRLAGVGVHARAINDTGQILACYLPVAHIQLYNGRRDGDPVWRAYDEAWQEARVLQERVVAYLEQMAVEKGFTVCTAGVIDLGETRPLRATWGSDTFRTA